MFDVVGFKPVLMSVAVVVIDTLDTVVVRVVVVMVMFTVAMDTQFTVGLEAMVLGLFLSNLEPKIVEI